MGVRLLFMSSVNLKLIRTIMNTEKTFLYFAYGSNLSTERIHLNNPSAVAKGPALLKGYKLAFNMGSNVSAGYNFYFITLL